VEDWELQTHSEMNGLRDEDLNQVVSPGHGPAVRPGCEEAVARGQAQVCVPATAWGNCLAKRCADVLGSLLLLLISAPIWPVVALLIKLGSQGPVFIRQSRAGRLEKPFRIFKFRSMREVSEADEQAMASLTRKVRSAHRTTRFGRVLRRTSLDELPQLLNVFLGHMSLVGPRPLVFGDLDDSYQIAPPEGSIEPGLLRRWRQARSQVRPGMTGLWQVSGRSSLPLEGWLRHDVEYVERCSPALDLHLLWRTVAVVLKGIGAS